MSVAPTRHVKLENLTSQSIAEQLDQLQVTQMNVNDKQDLLRVMLDAVHRDVQTLVADARRPRLPMPPCDCSSDSTINDIAEVASKEPAAFTASSKSCVQPPESKLKILFDALPRNRNGLQLIAQDDPVAIPVADFPLAHGTNHTDHVCFASQDNVGISRSTSNSYLGLCSSHTVQSQVQFPNRSLLSSRGSQKQSKISKGGVLLFPEGSRSGGADNGSRSNQPVVSSRGSVNCDFNAEMKHERKRVRHGSSMASNHSKQSGMTHISNAMLISARFLLSPESRKRHFWDTCSFLVFLYECVFIPVLLAWEIEENDYLRIGMWFTRVWWTLDIFLRFNTSYLVNGDLELRRSAIALHYLKRFFIFDFLATGSDWTSAVFFTKSKARMFVRLMRFLRISTMWNRMEKLHNLFLSDAWHKFIQVSMMLFGILLANHLVCCAWFWIGRVSKSHGRSWLRIEQEVNGQRIRFEELDAFYQYTTAYHWSVVQMFVGSVQINAMNSIERIFNIVCNLFGTFFTAVITSWLSALWVQHHQSKYDHTVVMKSVRRYLRDNALNPLIMSRILKQLEVRLSAKQYASESDIKAFDLLSKGLKAEMRREIWQPALLRCPVLYLLNRFDLNIILKFCSTLEIVPLLGGDELFQAGIRLDVAYTIVRGELHYTPVDYSTVNITASQPLLMDRMASISSADMAASAILCAEHTWLAEAALWCSDWTTRGNSQCLRAFAEVVAVEPQKLRSAFPLESKADSLMKEYSQVFQNLIVGVPQEDLSDIECPVDHASVIMNMNMRPRLIACQPVLQVLHGRDQALFSFSKRPPKGADELEKEIKSGECGLIFNADSVATRVAFVVLLRAERMDGMILVQVAKVSDGAIAPKLQMPAIKKKEGEMPDDAAGRILQNLDHLGEGQSLGSFSREVESRDTASYGIKTLFFRYVYHVSWSQDRVKHSASSVVAEDICNVMNRISTSSRRSRLALINRNLPKLSIVLPTRLQFVQSKTPTSGTIYAWMLESTFQALEEHSVVLNEWVATMTLPSPNVEKCFSSEMSGNMSGMGSSLDNSSPRA